LSRARSGEAALPGARPAERDAGRVPAPRNWRVATRLAVLVAIPTLLGLALTGLRVTDETRSAAAYGQVSRLAVLGHQVDGLAQAMEDERAGAATFIAAGRPAAGLPALQRQYLITDGWAAMVRRLVHQGDRGYPAQTQASAATALASIAGLTGLRREAAQSQAPALTVINGYSAATAGLFTLDDGLANLSGDATLMTSARALGSLARLADQASLQQAILSGALAEGHFGPGARTALITAQAQQASDLASFRSLATPEEGWAVTQTLASPLAGRAQAVEQRATASGGAALALGPGASQQWQTGMSFTEGWMRDAQQQMTTWITGYAQATQRSMMRTALITAGAALAVLVLVLLATIIIARSMVRPLLIQREAVRLASEEARRRRSISAISNGFFRRSHYLLERLLRLIDILERSEQDPGRLASLFQIDHLVTRMRRNSDSALVLAGHETSRDEAEPVTLVDVLRAAVSEIEQYHRVVLDVPVDDWVSGDAVADTVHLLAELLENATAFSPKTTQVIVSGHAVRGGGLLVSITDAGTGMADEHLEQLNWQLAHPSDADAAVSRHMGLFAVAHLAARHGISVALELPPEGGTAAEVYLPASLILPNAPGPVPGPRLETVVSAEGAALPVAVPKWQRAEPEQAEPEHAEQHGAERGGVLPIFESVESEYPRPRTELPQRIPQAGLASGTPADQAPQPARPAGSAETTREQLASFQRGSRRARAVVEGDRDTKQRARDH
jgi:signal transduction histidine kinase